MSTVVVLLTATGSSTGRGVVDLLRDWSAIGLVGDVAVVAEEDLRGSVPFPRVPATVLHGGQATRALLVDHLADARDLHGVRLVALSAPGADGAVVDAVRADALAAGLRQGLARVVPIQCIVARHGRGGWRPDVGWVGWHNVVVAPEEAWNPGSFREVLYDTHSDAEFLGHAASGVASLAGLWDGMQAGPLDDREAATAGQVVVARSFVRLLDASEVSGELRRELTDLRAGLPRPRTAGGDPLERATQPPQVAQQMADQLAATHAELFRADRRAYTPTPQKQIGALAALTMLLSFLVSVVRNAPRQWAERLVAGVASGVARQVNDVVFGEDAAYKVVVFGRDGRGRIARVDDLVTGAERMAEQLSTLHLDVEMPTGSLAPFWRNFVNAGLTLGDGGQHSEKLATLTAAGAPVVLARGPEIAPASAEPFVLRGRPAQRIAVPPIASYDVLAILSLRDELSRMVHEDPVAAVEAGAELERLDRWAAEVRTSYAGRVGKRIADFVRAAQRDVESLRGRLSEAARFDAMTAEVLDAQNRQVRRQRLLAVVLLVALVLLGILRWLDVLGVLVTFLLCVASLLGWFLSSFLVFMRGQASLFRLLHRREEHVREAEVARDNLVNAVRDVYRGSVLYRQFLEWAPLLGRFLAEPFGTARTPELPPIRLSGRLPRALGLGRAVPDRTGTARIAHLLGDQLFKVGWLGPQWERLLRDVPRRLGSRGFGLTAEPERLYADAAQGSDSVLGQWRRLVESDGVGDDLGAVMWQRAVAGLERVDPALVSEALLTETVVVGQQAHGITTLPGSEFLDDVLASLATRSFDLTLFSPAAQAHGSQRVTEVVVSAAGSTPPLMRSTGATGRVLSARPPRDRLDQFLVVTELSGGVPSTDLVLAGGYDADGREPEAEPAAAAESRIRL